MNPTLKQLLLDQNPDAIIATTLSGEILSWSRGAENVFGYSSEEVTGRLLSDVLLPPDRGEESARMVNEAVETGFAICESLAPKEGRLARLRGHRRQGGAR